MSMLTDEERDYILRIGEGSYENGIRRLIRYAKAMRHDLRGVQHGLGIQAALLRLEGHDQAATFLTMSVEQIGQMVGEAAGSANPAADPGDAPPDRAELRSGS